MTQKQTTPELSCALCGYFCNNPHHHNNWFEIEPKGSIAPYTEYANEYISKTYSIPEEQKQLKLPIVPWAK